LLPGKAAPRAPTSLDPGAKKGFVEGQLQVLEVEGAGAAWAYQVHGLHGGCSCRG
jgi:hypothetical protein